MPYAENSIDGVRTYYEDDGGDGPPVVVYSGLTQTIAASRSWKLARALEGHVRLIFADHRGHGQSDKPHDEAAYGARVRAGDFAAVLDAVGLEQASFLGYSWGGRLGFGVGAYQSARVTSLILGGSHPYAYGGDAPRRRAVTEGLAAAAERGMAAYVERIEELVGVMLPPSVRAEMEANDPRALLAAWSAGTGGEQITNLSHWTVPCLVYCGEMDESFLEAKRAAESIPGARFLALPGLDHMPAMFEIDALLPRVLEILGLGSG